MVPGTEALRRERDSIDRFSYRLYDCAREVFKGLLAVPHDEPASGSTLNQNDYTRVFQARPARR